MQTTNAKREWFHILAPILVGCLLLVGAGLKADQLIVDEATQSGLFGSRWFLITLVECELLLGIWLLSGVYSYRCRQAVLAIFAVFAIVAITKGLSGESSCGCFGRLQVNPWWMLLTDLVVLAVLWRWEPKDEKKSEHSHRVWLCTAAVTFVVVVGILVNRQPGQLSGDGNLFGYGQLVILEPEEWVGKQLPIMEHMDFDTQLASGEYVLLLYHHDCPKCQEALPKYQILAARLQEKASKSRVVLVETPPYSQALSKGKWMSPCLIGRLSEEREWFVQAPVEIRIRDGRVTSVSRELPSLLGLLDL